MKHRFLALTLICLASCSDGMKDGEAVRYEVGSTAGAPPAAPVPAQDAAEEKARTVQNVQQRKIIRTATLSVELKDYERWWTQLQKEISASGAYIVNSSVENVETGVRRGNATVRVPQDRYSVLLGKIRKNTSRVERENQTGQDVTEEFVDIEARLANKRRAEQRIQEILTKAGRIQDLLEAERELTRIREEIELVEGRKKFLESQVSYATIIIDWHEPYPIGVSYSGEKSFWDKIVEGFSAGVEGFGSVLGGLIAFLIGGIPVFVFAGIMIWLVRKLILRRKAIAITKKENEKRNEE